MATNYPPALVKELREKTGVGMMDCKKALDRDQRRHRSRHRLAAQEGPLQGRQEGRSHRRRGPRRRHRLGPHRRASPRSTRRPISSPATTSSRKWCRTITSISPAADGDVAKLLAATYPGKSDNGRGRGQGDDRHHRREHERAPHGHASRSARASSPTTCTTRSPTASARSACWSASRARATKPTLNALGTPDRDARRRHAIRWRSTSRACRPTCWSARRRSCSTRTRASRSTCWTRSPSRRSRATPRRTACSTRRSCIDDVEVRRAGAQGCREGKVGAPVKLAGFVRFALGEGIEKKNEDFADEVKKAGGA